MYHHCTECDELVVGEETVDVEVDWDEYYKYDDEGNPIGPGTIVSSNYNKYENAAITDFIAENYADPRKAREELGWTAQYTIDDMCAHSWNWQSNNPNGYKE